MDSRLNLILFACIVGLTIATARLAQQTGKWRVFWMELLALLAFVCFLNRWFGFPLASPAVSKGENDMVLAGAMAISMVAGMLAQCLYRHFSEPEQSPWQWRSFIAAICAAPIIFTPLAEAFSSSDVDLTKGRMTLPRLMIFLVAFENGFFWKEYFDQRQKDVKKRGRKGKGR